MRCLALLLVACGAPVVDEAVTDDGDSDDTTVDPGVDTDPPAVRPTLSSPAEAVDEDPAAGVFEVTLRAAAASHEIGGRQVDGYAYNGQVPGPTLRATVGDTLVAHLVNDLDVPTTIHWHGAGAPYEMDGVPWQRQPTPPGGTFTYTFPLTKAGTFWYHPHFDTQRQVDLGLYGVLVVEDPDEPAYDQDVVLVLDSWGESSSDEHDHGLEGQALTWTVNGLVDPVLPVVAGQTLRLRVLDASNTGYAALQPGPLRWLAGDQGVQTAPRQVDEVVLGPGDRLELDGVASGTLDLTSAPFSVHGGATWGDHFRLLTVQADGTTTASLTAWSTTAVAPSPDPGTTDLVYTFQGDSRTGQWRINHEAFPDVTIEEVALGDRVVMEVRNLSPTRHPFHAHGHAFEVLSVDGVPPAQRQVEDTVDVPVHGVVRLAFTAQRPGDWMVHCHILPHADGGMMTVMRVGEGT